MNCIIPFTKDIKFKTNIGEILSVSLEHEHTANNNEILGNFIISGEYKTHEVSVNKEHFEHVLPFSVELSNRIDNDSVDFTIEDFTYEVIDNDTLRVNIEYSVNALELKEDEAAEIDNILDEIDASINVEAPREEAKHEESKEEIIKNDEVNEEEVKEELEERNVDEATKDAVLGSINNKETEYITYNIHVMSETDTIESVCIKYNTTQNILGDYNDLNNIAIGDKLIIPEVDE